MSGVKLKTEGKQMDVESTDKLYLRIEGQNVAVSMDDNGRYSLNDIFRASGSNDSKKPAKFFRSQDVEIFKTWEIDYDERSKDRGVVVQKKQNRATVTFAPKNIFINYCKFISPEWGELISTGLSTDSEICLPSYESVKPGAVEQGLYLMKNEFGLHKIGITSDIDGRKSSLECSSGVSVDVINFWPPERFATESVTAFYIEQMIHEQFHKFRKNGEWFDFDVFFDESIVGVIEWLISNHSKVKPQEALRKAGVV